MQIAPTAAERWGLRLDTAAFFTLVLAVAMRPLLSETFYSNLEPMTRLAEAAGEPSPAMTVWLDLAIWLAGAAAALGAVLRRRRWNLTGIEIGGAILVVAAVVSTLAASNKRLAINGSATWLTGLVLVIILANLCRDRLRITLLLAALTASGAASVARCTMQKTLEFSETRQQYEQDKADFWARQNVLLDDPKVELYERRIKAAEANGFFALSNLEGAWLNLAGFSCLALRGLIIRRRRSPYVLLVLAAIMFGMILLTGSKGAIAGCLVGLFLWWLGGCCLAAMRERWRFTLTTLWVAMAGLISVAISYGVVTGGLPTDSLRFRWNYWQVSRDIIAQHFATGVGALNFDNAYLAAKPIEFPEEIRDPHNFIVSVVAQWGVLGGLGLLLVFLGGSYMAARTLGTREANEGPPPVHDPEARTSALQWVVALAIGFFVLRVVVMRGWLGQPSGNAYVFFDLGLYGLLWMITMAGLVWLVRGGGEGDLDLCQIACVAGILVFVLHSLIDFAMAYPGTLLPFAAAVGVLMARGSAGPAASPAGLRPGGPLVVLAAGAAALILFAVIPVTRATARLDVARFGGLPLHARWDLFEQAMDADPLDPTAPAELSFTYLASGGDVAQALQWLNTAIQRDPEQVGLYRARASMLELSFRQTGANSDLVAAVGSLRKVLAMFPNSPDDYVFLGDMITRNGEVFGLEEAVASYQRALELDSARPRGELRRWPARQREKIEKSLDELIARLSSSQPASSPAS